MSGRLFHCTRETMGSSFLKSALTRIGGSVGKISRGVYCNPEPIIGITGSVRTEKSYKLSGGWGRIDVRCLNSLNKLVLLLPILLLALAFMIPGAVPPVHAVSTPTGEVCIAQPPMATKCPTYPAIFAATTALTAVDVNVNYGGPVTAQTFNTFDISVNVTQAALNAPTTTTCSGPGGSCGVTVDPAFGVVAEVCINGIAIVGTCSPTDGAGIVHVVAGSFNFVNNNQTLLTIHYASGTTTAAGVGINYLNGCTGTSTSDGTTCVTLVNQTGGSAPVSLETGYFASVATFFVTAFPSALTINGGFWSTSTANITAVNGLGAATVTMTATVSPAGPTANLASGTVSLTRTIQKATDLLTITVPSGFSSNFTVTVTGAVSTNVHSFVISVTVPPTPPSSLLSVVEGNGGALYWSMFTFFFNDTATTEIYTLSLHDALPISRRRPPGWRDPQDRGTCRRDGRRR